MPQHPQACATEVVYAYQIMLSTKFQEIPIAHPPPVLSLSQGLPRG